MSEEVYRQLRETMARRGPMVPVMDIPEFYEMARVLFTPEEAEISNAMPRGTFTPGVIAQQTGRSEQEVTAILEAMADKGLCSSVVKGDGTRVYYGPPLMPGILEYQFMRGTKTDRDRRIARVIHNYKEAVQAAGAGMSPITSPPSARIIPVDRKVEAENMVQTWEQVLAYIEEADPISVATCYCRHEALLLDEKDVCGMPMEVCFQFGRAAEYVIERGIARRVTKEEATEIMRQAEEAGLIHLTVNTQKIDFICNCCPCHCVALKTVLSHPKPAQAILCRFRPSFDPELCVADEICIDRCPASALTLGEERVPEVDLERCIGCGVCASGCLEGAITLVERDEFFVPPADRKALGVELMKSLAERGS